MPPNDTITIVAPLAFEAGLLKRSRPARNWTILTCGPGRRGIEIGLESALPPSGSTVILAGTAGGLCGSRAAGTVLIAERIIDADGDHSWTPPLQADRGDLRTGTLCTSEQLIGSPEMKAALHARTGADAVDQEAIHFAKLAEGKDWNWGVVRGISDPADSALPPQAARWIDHRGRTRLWSLLSSLLLAPGLLAALPRLQRDARSAMEAVAKALPDLTGPHGS